MTSMGKITSTNNLFDDGKTLYDEHGNKIGTQYKNLFDDGVSTYDKYGNKVATSYNNIFDDGVSTYDQYGNKVASSYRNLFDDGVTTYDQYGNKVAQTYNNWYDPLSSTTTTYGGSSAAYGGSSAAYGAGSYAADTYTGGTSYSGGGYYVPTRTPREKRKDAICYRTAIAGIVCMVLCAVYALVGLFKPDILTFNTRLFPIAYAASLFIYCFFRTFDYNYVEGEHVFGMAMLSLLYLFFQGQAMYNANGYNEASGAMAWRSVGNMAWMTVAALAAGYIGGLFANTLFTGGGIDGKTGTVVTALLCLAVAAGVLIRFGVLWLDVRIYTAICCVLLFISLFNTVKRFGKGGFWRSFFRGLIMTLIFSAVDMEITYWTGLRQLLRLLVSARAAGTYLLFAGVSIAAMAAAGVARSFKKK